MDYSIQNILNKDIPFLTDREICYIVGKFMGMIFTESPKALSEKCGEFIWALRFNFPPEGDWENNSFMIGRAGEVKRVLDCEINDRLSKSQELEWCADFWIKDSEWFYRVEEKIFTTHIQNKKGYEDYEGWPIYPFYIQHLIKLMTGRSWSSFRMDELTLFHFSRATVKQKCLALVLTIKELQLL